MSMKGKLVTDMIRFFTSQRLLGPKIQDGTLRKNLIEPSWRCPEGFINLLISMKNFQMELLTPKLGECEEVVLQFHGGGYIAGMRNAYRDFAVLYSTMGRRRRVLSVDYRLAPENPYPAALEDAVEAYQWLLDADYAGKDIIVAGDSAGGGLALALVMYLRDHGIPLPQKLVMMSPWTDLTASGDSYRDNYTHDPLFGNTRESMIYNGEYVGGQDPRQPYISPLFGDFSGLPPMLFQVGGLEMLLSDSVVAAQKAREAGCEVILSVYEEMFHVFQMGMDKLTESKAAWEEVRRFLF
jgi:acetyl esterase/lipase